MTEHDINLIKQRAKKLKEVIKAQEKLPKKQRDHAAIEDAKKRLMKYDEWLKGDKKKKVEKKIVTKNEFREEFKKTFNIDRDATEQITIDTVEQLREVWPVIRKKVAQGKVEMNIPPEVKAELKKIIKLERERQKFAGFR